jgi:arginyl-tRNA synthetase
VDDGVEGLGEAVFPDADRFRIGAVKYADLSTDRVKDYVFDWDRMLSFGGNSAGYLQMAYARIRSILRKAEHELEGGTVVRIEEPAEHALALDLLTFPTIVQQTAAALEFHRLAGYLYRLATTCTLPENSAW